MDLGYKPQQTRIWTEAALQKTFQLRKIKSCSEKLPEWNQAVSGSWWINIWQNVSNSGKS